MARLVRAFFRACFLQVFLLFKILTLGFYDMAKSTSAGHGFIKSVATKVVPDTVRVYQQGLSTGLLLCQCGQDIASARYLLGYRHCLSCGEKLAKQRKHTVVPMPKSNYILVTDMSLLKGLNSSHKGGVA